MQGVVPPAWEAWEEEWKKEERTQALVLLAQVAPATFEDGRCLQGHAKKVAKCLVKQWHRNFWFCTLELNIVLFWPSQQKVSTSSRNAQKKSLAFSCFYRWSDPGSLGKGARGGVGAKLARKCGFERFLKFYFLSLYFKIAVLIFVLWRHYCYH